MIALPVASSKSSSASRSQLEARELGAAPAAGRDVAISVTASLAARLVTEGRSRLWVSAGEPTRSVGGADAGEDARHVARSRTTPAGEHADEREAGAVGDEQRASRVASGRGLVACGRGAGGAQHRPLRRSSVRSSPDRRAMTTSPRPEDLPTGVAALRDLPQPRIARGRAGLPTRAVSVVVDDAHQLVAAPGCASVSIADVVLAAGRDVARCDLRSVDLRTLCRGGSGDVDVAEPDGEVRAVGRPPSAVRRAARGGQELADADQRAAAELVEPWSAVAVDPRTPWAGYSPCAAGSPLTIADAGAGNASTSDRRGEEDQPSAEHWRF